MAERHIYIMDFYIRFMLCISITVVMLIFLKTLLDRPLFKLKKAIQKKSFIRKINIGRFSDKELLDIKRQIEKALEINGYICESNRED